jgi:uncharacterized protein
MTEPKFTSESPSEDDLQYLEDFLDSDSSSESSMTIAMLDGFLTAIVSGPNTIAPSVWMPLVWDGSDPPEMPAFESEEQAERLFGTVFRLLNDIVGSLMSDPEEHTLLIDQAETDDGQMVELIDNWCVGFMQGVSLDKDGWMPLILERQDLFSTLLLFGTDIDEGGDAIGAKTARNEGHVDKALLTIDELNDYSMDLQEVIPQIHNYWLEKRKPIRVEPKPGRNDICPCGSGKKFKHCHALN